MRLGHLVVLSALLVTKAAANCDKKDCETGLSVGVAAGSTCAAVGGAFCAFTFGVGCIVAGVCGATAGVATGAKEACRACGDGGGGAGIDVDRLTELLTSNTDRLSNEMRTNIDRLSNESRANTDRLSDESRANTDRLSDESRANTDRLSDESRANTNRLSNEIRANTDRLIDDINILTLSVEEVIDKSLEIEGQIKISQIIGLYGQDITNYQKIRNVFKRLKKNSNGLIMRNSDAIRFATAANDPIDGLAASSLQIFQMMTGGHPLKPESIFQAVPDFCQNKAKEYFVKVMFDCYMLESVARAMSGESMHPTSEQEFKRQLILIEDHFIQICECPAHLVKSIRQSGLLSALLSLARSLPVPAGHCSSEETYIGQPIPSFIMDDSTDRLTLQKITLLYSIAPFSTAKSAAAKATAKKYRVEEIEVAQYLFLYGSLADLTLYENSLFCARYTSGVFKLHSDSQFEYFKVAVDSGVTMVEGATVTACRKYGLEAACRGPRSGCRRNDETKCQVVPIETHCGWPLRGISQAVCDGETDASECAELEGVFQYLKGWSGGKHGVLGGDWALGKDHTSGDGGKILYAYCAKAR